MLISPRCINYLEYFALAVPPSTHPQKSHSNQVSSSKFISIKKKCKFFFNGFDLGCQVVEAAFLAQENKTGLRTDCSPSKLQLAWHVPCCLPALIITVICNVVPRNRISM